jgi:hypothetical protein
MLSCLNKVKAILTGHAEPKEKNNAVQLVNSTPLPEPRKTQFIYPVSLRRQEKAHSVKLLDGYVSENPGSVRAKGCGMCRETPQLIAINYANPCLALFGCDKVDCLKKLIRIDTA